MQKWPRIRPDWSLLFTDKWAAKPLDTWQAAWTNLFSEGGASPQCGCCSSAQGLQLTSHSCWGLMTEHCKSQQRGHFLNSAGLALIGSGTAILAAYLIASWEKSPVKCESKHVDCRVFRLSNKPDEKAYFYTVTFTQSSFSFIVKLKVLDYWCDYTHIKSVICFNTGSAPQLLK